MMKKLKYAFLLLLLFSASLSGFASHDRGADLWYECVSGCTTRVFVEVYTDCSSPVPPSVNVGFRGIGSGCNQPVAVTGWTNLGANEVTPICPTTVTTCNSGSAMGIQATRYFADFDFCSTTCNEYDITWKTCCSNAGLSNVPTQITVYNEVRYNKSANCNSSPDFNYPHAIAFCAGQYFSFSNQGYDPDGDSLVYSIRNCKTDTTTYVTYNAGYSGTQPLGPSWYTQIDPQTGDLSFTPLPGNLVSSIFCITVEEYRNGVFIGSSSREITVNTYSCSNSNPQITAKTNVSGGSFSGNHFVTSTNTAICFDLITKDGDSLTQNQALMWDKSLAGATFTALGSASGTDTISGANPSGTFCWTTPATKGAFQVVFTVRDTACPYYGYVQQSIMIHVLDSTDHVWPGDANNDLIADAFDVLAIGYNYLDSVAARPNASNNWTGQPMFNWGIPTYNGADAKYADCNGDAVVNIQDTLAISQNYGLTHTKTGGVQAGNLPFYVDFLDDSLMIGDTAIANIYLGTMADPGSNVYGYAFKLNFDNSLVDSAGMWIDYSPTWIGNSGNSLNFRKDLWSNGRFDGAHVRNNHSAVSGYGQVATLHIILTDNIDGKVNTTYQALHLNVLDVLVIDSAGAEIPVNMSGDSLVIVDPLAAADEKLDANSIRIFPNPAHAEVTIQAASRLEGMVQVIDLNGKTVLEAEANGFEVQLNTAKLAEGLYLVRIPDGGKGLWKKLLIMH